VLVSPRVASAKDSPARTTAESSLERAARSTGTLWFGWSGRTASRVLPVPALKHDPKGARIATLDLTEEERSAYLNRHCDGVLRPVLYSEIHEIHYDGGAETAYRKVNERFAAALMPLLAESSRVWVHDYPMLHVGQALRRLGFAGPLGFSLDAPFPGSGVLQTLPSHRGLTSAFFAYDIVTFQAERDCLAFRRHVVDTLAGQPEGPEAIRALGQRIETRTLTLGIDAANFRRRASKSATTESISGGRAHNSERLIVGIDRADPSRALTWKLEAYAVFLERYPDLHGGARLWQILAENGLPTEAERELRRELEHLSGAINAHYSDIDWTPLRCLARTCDADLRAALYRRANVGLLTPLRDSASRDAMEFVAAQARSDPGVLVLSELASVAPIADGALLVHPHEPGVVADALRSALHLPLDERIDRWQRLADTFAACDADRWVAASLEAMGLFDLGANRTPAKTPPTSALSAA